MEWVNLFKNVVTQTPRVLLGLFIASALIIGATFTLLDCVTLSEFYASDPLLTWVYGIFIVSPSLLASYCAVKYVPMWVNKRRDSRVAEQNLYELKQRLHVLTKDEKEVLRPYIQDNKRAQEFSIRGGGAHECLVNRGFLYPAARIQTYDGLISFCITQWVKEYLEKHPDLLKNP